MDRWDEATSYDRFMGHWSRLVAERFLEGLGVPADAAWLDVGCGTGTLLDTIARTRSPARLAGVDPSAAFLATAARRLSDPAELKVGEAEQLPFGDADFDAVVSGLMLNFIPDPLAAVVEMRRVARPGGLIAAYVWDYADGMQLLRSFWDVATELDATASAADEGRRFPICRPEPLRRVFEAAGTAEATVTAVEVATTFGGFDDYWQPFLSGQGPAPGYVAALSDEAVERLRETLRRRLPTGADGAIHLTARAWAVMAVA